MVSPLEHGFVYPPVVGGEDVDWKRGNPNLYPFPMTSGGEFSEAKADHTPQGRFSQTTVLCIINTCATHLIKHITAAEMFARLKSKIYFQCILKNKFYIRNTN